MILVRYMHGVRAAASLMVSYTELTLFWRLPNGKIINPFIYEHSERARAPDTHTPGT
jgi:hypothetical protein